MAPSFIAENITHLRGLRDGHHLIPIHDRLQSLQRVHLRHHNVGSHPPGPHSQAFSAPPIPTDDEYAPGDEPIGGTNNPIYGGLARAVSIIEEMLRIRIVDRNDGEL
jgi:hypothetical protein